MDADGLWPRLGRYVPIIPTPKQAAFLLLAHKEAFYGGAAGGGTSVALLAAALQYADVPGYSALLVRRSYMELQQPNGLILDEATCTTLNPNGGPCSTSTTLRISSG